MHKTPYGEFNGDSWERFCQMCLKHKFDTYRPMEAHSGGDLGIEGYIEKDGIVYQCYCPDENYEANELYAKQRDKITTDLAKIEKNKLELAKYIKDNKIKQWIFLTPQVLNKELNKHCITKREEYRAKNLDILAIDFDILYKDIDYFVDYFPHEVVQVAINLNGSKIKLNNQQTTDEETANWKGSNTLMFKNIDSKLAKLYVNDEKRKRQVDSQILHLLNGYKKEDLLKRFGNSYEKFLSLRETLVRKTIEICDLQVVGDSQKTLKMIDELIEKHIKEYMGQNIDEMELLALKEFVISDWLANCPINFE